MGIVHRVRRTPGRRPRCRVVYGPGTRTVWRQAVLEAERACMPEGRLLSFYGDDFTGSTDTMEALAKAGLRTVLFLEPPGPEQLARFEGVRAVGVAGVSRSLSPAEMDAELPPLFAAMRRLEAPLFHL